MVGDMGIDLRQTEISRLWVGLDGSLGRDFGHGRGLGRVGGRRSLGWRDVVSMYSRRFALDVVQSSIKDALFSHLAFPESTHGRGKEQAP